jgi:hypothetical protein
MDTGRKSAKSLSRTLQKPINFALFSEDELKVYETKQKLRFENVQENQEREKKKMEFKKMVIMTK